VPTSTTQFWPYQAVYSWSRGDGTLTDQSRLWLNALYRTVATNGGGGGGSFTAGGDLSGTNTVQTVIGLQGNPVSATAPTNGQVLTWVSVDGMWEPKSVTVPVLPLVVRETPAGTMNGTNTAFTLSFAPNPAASLTLWLNGVEQIPTADYTLTSATLTYVVAPKSADLMIAQYSH
jgi:hypothetical protein